MVRLQDPSALVLVGSATEVLPSEASQDDLMAIHLGHSPQVLMVCWRRGSSCRVLDGDLGLLWDLLGLVRAMLEFVGDKVRVVVGL